MIHSPLAAAAVAALWVAVEVTHGSLGFAWLALGNAGIDMSLPMRLAPWTGVYGLSFVFALTAALLAQTLLGQPRRRLLWLSALPLLILLPPLPGPEPGRNLATVVQPNFSEDENWTEASLERAHHRLAHLSATVSLARKTDLVVWPEMPAPLYWDRDPRFRESVSAAARIAGAPVLTGTVAHLPDGGVTNSALVVSPAGQAVSRYDKVHLVPFGEFVPWPLGFAEKISTETGDFRAGENATVTRVDGHLIGAFICYESVFPRYVRQFVREGAEVLYNLSNDGYFGRSAAREQHLGITRMRAAENARWILRATNNGVTAAIDPAGRVRDRLPIEAEAVKAMPFSYASGLGFYTRYGDWFPVLCAAFAAAALWKRVASPGGFEPPLSP